MSRRHSLSIGRRVVIAALVGGVCGTSAGLWSVVRTSIAASPTRNAPRPPANAITEHAAVVAAPVPEVAAAPTFDAGATVTATTGHAAPLEAPPPAPAAARPAAVDADTDVASRARALAQRADVTALVALRDSLVQRAQQRGESASPVNKQQLDELDRYLAEARFLRLKLDADAFKLAEPAGARPR